jgi:hypothetical protein
VRSDPERSHDMAKRKAQTRAKPSARGTKTRSKMKRAKPIPPVGADDPVLREEGYRMAAWAARTGAAAGLAQAHTNARCTSTKALCRL